MAILVTIGGCGGRIGAGASLGDGAVLYAAFPVAILVALRLRASIGKWLMLRKEVC